MLVNPVFEAPTAEMRAVLPKEVPMKSMINNCCQGGSLVRILGEGGMSNHCHDGAGVMSNYCQGWDVVRLKAM